MSEYIVVHGIRIAKDYKDFVPETFGRLTTIGPRFLTPYGNQGRSRPVQVCLCDCTTTLVVSTCLLRKGHTKSCGCLQKERTGDVSRKHGMWTSPEYRNWQSMRERCNNQNSHAYPDYGGRGISVHPDWDNTNNGFQNFYDYMGPRPSPMHSIDRYPDRDGNYEPGNVRWANKTDQARNRDSSVFLTHNGKTQCVTAWAEEVGVQAGTLYYRLRKGWTVEKALTHPVRSVTPR